MTSQIRLKVKVANNKILVKNVTPPENRIKVQVSQNVSKVTAIVRGPRGRVGADGTGGDKHFEMDFTNQSVVTVPHNLGKRPAVTVENSAHDVVVCAVNHVNDNLLTISSNGSFSGVVFCN